MSTPTRILATTIVFATAVLTWPQGMCMPAPSQSPVVALSTGTIIQGVGTSDLPITSQSEKAKQLVRQGFALIHCFWFNEAVRSFRDATKEDPACATAWLGLNASLTLPWHTPSAHRAEAEYAIKRAVQTCGNASDVEQALVAAFRLRSASQEDRESEFERAMDRLIETHPKLNEPRLLLSVIRVQLCMNDDYDSKYDPQTEMPKVMRLIGPVLEKDPTNAAALHYRIHALEGNEAEKAVAAADQLGKSAPASSHMVHMPGHIYNRVGMYDKAYEVFSRSVKIDEEYAPRIEGATPNTNWNYSHNLDYLIFNLSEMGRIKEAEELLKKNPNSAQMLLWRTGSWSKLSERSQTSFNLGMAAATRGDVEAAEKHAAVLEEWVQKNGENGRNVTRARMEKVRARELRGMILSRQGKHDEALISLKEAVAVFDKIGYSEPPYYVRPPHESLGEAAIAAGRWDEAIKAYEAGLKHRPNSGWMLYGIASANEKAGRKEAAGRAYQAFLKAWATADADLPQVQRAKSAVR